MPDTVGTITTLGIFGGTGYGIYTKAPPVWLAFAGILGLTQHFGTGITKKNPEKVMVQLVSCGYLAYESMIEGYINPKHMRVIAPVGALCALNVARCSWRLWNNPEPIRKF